MLSKDAFTEEEERVGFAVRYTPEKGRNLVASRSFPAGAVVLEQDPYAAVLSDECTPGCCDFCFRRCERPLRCSRSKLARYCSKEHQRMAWSAGYKLECEALVRCAPRVPPPTVRLASRILWRRARALQQAHQHPDPTPNGGAQLHTHNQPPRDSDYVSLWRLQHHWEALEDRRKQLYAQMAVVTWQYMFGSPDAPAPSSAANGDDGDAMALPAAALPSGAAAAPPPVNPAWPGFRSVAQLLAILAANCHTVCDEELRPLGTALFPTGALVNHSCRPNTVQGFRGGTLQLWALQPLAPGDEITIAYIELAATRQERRETLAGSYFFDIGSQPPTPQPVALPATEATAGADSSTAMVIDSVSVDECEIATAAGTSTTSASQGSSRHQTTTNTSTNRSVLLRPSPVLSLDIGPNAQLLVYDIHSEQPPWPTDPWDSELTHVMAACGTEAALMPARNGDALTVGESGGGVSGRRACGVRTGGVQPGGVAATTTTTVTGGLLARLVPRRPNEPEEADDEQGKPEDEDDDDEMELGEGEGEEHAARMSSTAGSSGRLSGGQYAMRRLAMDGLCSTLREDSSEGAPTRPRPPALQLPAGNAGASRAPRIELLAWGPWVGDVVKAAARAEAANGPMELRTAVSGAQAGVGDGAVGMEPVDGGAPESSGQQGQMPLRHATVNGEGGDMEQQEAKVEELSTPYAVVSGLLRRCVRALQLAAQAEAEAGSGDLIQPVRHLQTALQLLDRVQQPLQSHPPQAPNTTACVATVEATAHADASVQAQQAITNPQGANAAGHPGPSPTLGLGPHHILRTRLLAQLLKAAVDLGSQGGSGDGVWGVACRAARALEGPYRQLYPHSAWPNLSLHYATMAKLEMLLGRPRRALAAASRALEGLRVTHSGGGAGMGIESGDVMGQVVRVGREAEAELQGRCGVGATHGRWQGGSGEGAEEDDDER